MIVNIEKLKPLTDKLNILFVEDEDVAKEQIKQLLECLFLNVFCASNGEEALHIFKKNSCDIVLTDIKMPKMDGLELVGEIKKISKTTPILILSQHDESKIIIECINLQADGYILKPVDYDILLKGIEKALHYVNLEREKKNFELYSKQYLNLFNNSNVISKTDIDGNIIYINDYFTKVTQYDKKELIGKNHSFLRHPDNPKEIYVQMWDTIKNKKQKWEGVLKNTTKNGYTYYAKTIVVPILNTDSEIVEFVATRDSIDNIVDDKTLLMEDINKNEICTLAILQIKEFEILEKFYTISTLYHLEKNFIFTLKNYFPSNYNIENCYSLGNGQFAFLESYETFGKNKKRVHAFMQQFLSNITNATLNYDQIKLDMHATLSYSIGKDLLFEDTKFGLAHGIKNRLSLVYSNDFSVQASIEAKENLQIIKDIKLALENSKIVSFFQPIVDNKTQKTQKYESLVRLINEKDEVISPAKFLEISKQSNYYAQITRRVLENSFETLDKIEEKISINIALKDIENTHTRAYIFELLDRYSHSCSRVIFELLEEESIGNFDLVFAFVKNLKKRGVLIAIDDFGSGYSNYERLLKFQPDILKIDASLIKNIATDIYAKSVVETIVLFAKKQNIETIAEYVENEEIYSIVKDIGIDCSQGYYFSKPIKSPFC